MSSAATTVASGPDASPQTRRTPAALRGAAPSWAAVAAWGAGLVQLALGAGAVTQEGAARGAGIALVVLGASALAWGAVTLARGRIVVPRAGVAVSLAGVAAAVAALAADPVRVSVAAVAAASILLLTIALACATRLRSRGGSAADASPPRVWAIIVAAVVVAALATPALAATDAGRSAKPHGEHGIVDPGHH